MLIVGFLLGGVWPFGATDRASAITPQIVGSPLDAPLDSGDVRVVARYASWRDMPDAAHFEALGLVARYRYHAVPAWILEGPDEVVRGLVGNERNLERIEYDRPLKFFMDTATFATNAVDVWGGTWWPTPVVRKSPSPLKVDGTVIDGRGVTVGVVDSGINALHPDLWYNPLYVPGMPWSPKVLECTNVALVFEPDVGNPYCDQSVGHGTHVAGIVAGTGWAVRNGLTPLQEPSKPYVGAAPGASLVGAGIGAADQILLASVGLDWMYANAAEFGIRVVTNSWGDSPGCSASLPSTSDIVIEITDSLVKDKGIVVLYAASNYAGSTPTWTSTYARNPTPGVISVANYAETGAAGSQQGNRNGKISGSSSDGCVASGGVGDYLWTWPDVAAPGTSIASTAAYTGVTIPATWDPGMYASASGTSMATPHVAGIVALMLQANPELTPAEVERILIETSTTWPSDGVAARSRTGTTMWNASPASCYVTPADAARAEAGDTGVNGKFPLFTTLAQRTDADLFVCRDFKRGVGLVDAYAAVQEALGGDDPDPITVAINAPAEGATVPEGTVSVAGTVSRPPPGSSEGGGTLFLVGDGTTTVITDADQTTNFGLSSLGHGNRETTYATALGNNAAPRNPFMPTFIGAERVHLSGGAITLKVPVLYTGVVNLAGDICAVDSNLFDATTGLSLLTANARDFLAPSPDYQEAVFTFTPKVGTYNGIIVQVGSSNLDCGRFPQVWRWGTDAFNGRLTLGSLDWIGSEPVDDSDEKVEVFLDGASSPSAFANVSTRTTGVDSWSVDLNLAGAPGPHTIEARWSEDGTLLATDQSSFVVEAARVADLSITQPPTDGETLQGATLLFGGGYSTTAGASWFVEARLVDSLGAPIEDWSVVAAPAANSDGVWSYSWATDGRRDSDLVLEVRLAEGATSVLSKSRGFHYNAPNELPTAAFTAPSSAYRAAGITFDGSASSDADGTLVAFEWDFGDGATGTGATIQHTYTSLGLFTVELMVTDADGATSVARATIDIDNAPPVPMIAGPAEVRPHKDATFDATGSSDPDGSIRSYFWDFGDGEAATGATATHGYRREGTYTVVLTVIDNDWRASEATATIVVAK